jgi:hypothetical protein
MRIESSGHSRGNPRLYELVEHAPKTGKSPTVWAWPELIDYLKIAGQPVAGPWPPHQEPRPDPEYDSGPVAVPDPESSRGAGGRPAGAAGPGAAGGAETAGGPGAAGGAETAGGPGPAGGEPAEQAPPRTESDPRDPR